MQRMEQGESIQRNWGESGGVKSLSLQVSKLKKRKEFNFTLVGQLFAFISVIFMGYSKEWEWPLCFSLKIMVHSAASQTFIEM